MNIYFLLKDLTSCFSDTSSLEIDKSEFMLGSVIDAVASQVITQLTEKGLQLIRDIPEETKTISACGDQTRIQQVLTDFLLSMISFAPSTEGWIEIQVRTNLKQNSNENKMLLHFRSSHLMNYVSI